MEKKKAVEFNFGTFLIILVIILAIVFVVARKTGENIIPSNENKDNQTENQTEYTQNLYSKNIITIDLGKLSDKWKVIDKEYGSILFYIQGPKIENEDGTYNDIRINVYMEKSDMTNDALKKQMLENSIYQKIEYTKMQEINSIQWMEFQAENKGVKAKILALMRDGYMYALEINGEENLYKDYYNEAMRAVMTVQLSEKIDTEKASKVIYEYDNIANIKTGGTRFLLTSLNLPITLEEKEETLPEEYIDYKWTGIKYEDFLNAMKEYMTEDVIKTEFIEFINYNGALYIKETTGVQTEYMIEEIKAINIKGNETTYEVSKSEMDTFVTEKQEITLKNEGDKCVVSAVK